MDRQRYVVAQMAKVLRDSMHDPASFVLTEVIFTDEGAGCYEYRARNGYNALRSGKAVFTGIGFITSDKQSDLVQAWNRYCTKPGKSIVNYVNQSVL